MADDLKEYGGFKIGDLVVDSHYLFEIVSIERRYYGIWEVYSPVPQRYKDGNLKPDRDLVLVDRKSARYIGMEKSPHFLCRRRANLRKQAVIKRGKVLAGLELGSFQTWASYKAKVASLDGSKPL